MAQILSLQSKVANYIRSSRAVSKSDMVIETPLAQYQYAME